MDGLSPGNFLVLLGGEPLLEAVNYMLKFGRRLRVCLEQYCIMEKEK